MYDFFNALYGFVFLNSFPVKHSSYNEDKFFFLFFLCFFLYFSSFTKPVPYF